MIDREALDKELTERISTGFRRLGGVPAIVRSNGGAQKVVEIAVREAVAAIAYLTALASPEGAQAGEVVEPKGWWWERLVRMASQDGWIERWVSDGSMCKPCDSPEIRNVTALYPRTTPPAPDDAVRAEPEGWCQPMRSGEHMPRQFIVRFDDQDRGDAVFDNEDEAYEFWERANFAWNCYLFGAMPLRARKGGAE